MFKYFIKLALLCAMSIGLHAESGFDQSYLVSVYPKNLSEFETADTSIEVEFSFPILTKSVHKNTIVLKDSYNNRLSGSITALGNTLIFKPDSLLKVGTHEVFVSKVKEVVASQVKFDVNTTTNIMTDKIRFSFTVPDITSISINSTSIELKEGTQTTLSAFATLADGTNKDIPNNIEWIIGNNSIVSTSDNMLSGLTEGVTTVQAKFNNILSEPVQIVVYKEVNGYKLPPEPDPTINNSTLLGIDFNDNGVRDDVERKVITSYQTPIKIELMMSYSKVAQKILENPIGLAKEHSEEMDKISDCEMFLRRQNIKLENNIDFFENNTFNTKQRVRAYLDHNLALSGGVYGSGPADWNAEACNFNVEQMLQDIK
jgi:hypothetical protein